MNRSALRRHTALAALAMVVFVGVFAASQGSAAPIAAEPPDIRAQQETQEEALGFPLTAVTLQPGWNLVGWMGEAAVANATASIVGPFQSLFTYDAALQDFRSFRPESPVFLNTLETLAFGDGVWIFVEQETDWFQPAPWWARSIDLLAGFNLITWTGPNNTPIDEALAGLGSALIAAFSYDAAAQTFLSFGPDRPDFLNSAEILNYGDGVWLELDSPATWDQPPLPRIGTQDVTFLRRIARIDDTGAEVDITDQVLALAETDLGPPIALQLGLVFQEARSLSGGAVAENGVALPSIEMTFGVVTRSSEAPNPAADALLGASDRVLVSISSPHLEQANYNIDLNDFAHVDLSAIEGIAVGDELRLDFLFAQTLERRGPLAEDGLNELAIFARRWNDGDFQILSGDIGDGELAAASFTGQGAHVVAGSVNARWMAKAAVAAAAIDAGSITEVMEAVNGDPILLPFVQLFASAELNPFLSGIAAVILANFVPLDIVEFLVGPPLPPGMPVPQAPPVPTPPFGPPEAEEQTPLEELREELLRAGARTNFNVFFSLLYELEDIVPPRTPVICVVQNLSATGSEVTIFLMGPMYPGVTEYVARFEGFVGTEENPTAEATVTGTVVGPDGATATKSAKTSANGGFFFQARSRTPGTFTLTIDSITCGEDTVSSGATQSITVE